MNLVLTVLSKCSICFFISFCWYAFLNFCTQILIHLRSVHISSIASMTAAPCNIVNNILVHHRCFHSTSISICPPLILSMISWGGCPSTAQPTDWQVPRISLMVPSSFLAIERGRIVLATSVTCSKVRLLLCVTGKWQRNTLLNPAGQHGA